MNQNSKLSKKVRKHILNLSYKAKSSHIGSCLSIVDILTVLYNDIFNNKNKKNFILSKGHACLALYSILHEKKIISKKDFLTYGKDNSVLMNHASHHVNGVNFSTGSLGHGLPVATGLALSLKLKKDKNKVFVLISDGELNEGTTWESLMFAAHHSLNNLVIIVDYNKLQSLTSVKKTLNLEPLRKKFDLFNCKTFNIDGHNFLQLKKVLNFKSKTKPVIIIANTIKGKGVSFMENKIAWHYKSPNLNDLRIGLREIDNA